MSSLGLSAGQYNLPAGVVFSMPVSFQDGRWSVLSDVIISDEMRAKLQIAADQLKEVSIVTRTQAQQSTSHSLVCFCASVFRLFSRTSKISIENNCGGNLICTNGRGNICTALPSFLWIH